MFDLFNKSCAFPHCEHLLNYKAVMGVMAGGMRQFCISLKEQGLYDQLDEFGKELVDNMVKEQERIDNETD